MHRISRRFCHLLQSEHQRYCSSAVPRSRLQSDTAYWCLGFLGGRPPQAPLSADKINSCFQGADALRNQVSKRICLENNLSLRDESCEPAAIFVYNYCRNLAVEACPSQFTSVHMDGVFSLSKLAITCLQKEVCARLSMLTAAWSAAHLSGGPCGHHSV